MLFGDSSYTLMAGVEFDFTRFVAGGVDRFTILGIDAAEGLDPIDPRAFVTGLGFMGAGATEVRMTPLSGAVPEPSTLLMTSAGLGLLGLARRRWRSLK